MTFLCSTEGVLYDHVFTPQLAIILRLRTMDFVILFICFLNGTEVPSFGDRAVDAQCAPAAFSHLLSKNKQSLVFRPVMRLIVHFCGSLCGSLC